MLYRDLKPGDMLIYKGTVYKGTVELVISVKELNERWVVTTIMQIEIYNANYGPSVMISPLYEVIRGAL